MAERRTSGHLNKQTIDSIAELIRKGLPKNRACEKIGVHRSTLHGWLMEADRIGENKPKDEHEKMVLYAAKTIQAARAELLERIVLNVQVQGKEDWRAWAWMGERMFPADLAEHHNVKADVTTDRPCEAAQALLAVAELTKKEKDDA